MKNIDTIVKYLSLPSSPDHVIFFQCPLAFPDSINQRNNLDQYKISIHLYHPP